MYQPLMFSTLRLANVARLPQFKNGKGEIAHSHEDGSDWSPAQWFQAMMGELGEWASLRTDYEAGRITRGDFCTENRKELADVQTYLDILARRSMDEVATPNVPSVAQRLMSIVAALGTYANWRKKFERGDIEWEEMQKYSDAFKRDMTEAMLNWEHCSADHRWAVAPTDQVLEAHSFGVDLGMAVANKFNEVSERVGSTIFIEQNRVVNRTVPLFLVTRQVTEDQLTPEERAEFAQQGIDSF